MAFYKDTSPNVRCEYSLHGQVAALTKVLDLCHHYSVGGEGDGAGHAVPHQGHVVPLAVIHWDVGAVRHKFLDVFKELDGYAGVSGLQQHSLVSRHIRTPARTKGRIGRDQVRRGGC